MTARVSVSEALYGLPFEFSLLMSLKLDYNTKGYAFILCDNMDNVYLTVRLGSSIGLLFGNGSRSDSNEGTLELEVNVADGVWHFVSFSMTGKVLTVWLDCHIIYNEPRTLATTAIIPHFAMMTMSLPKLKNLQVRDFIQNILWCIFCLPTD